MTRSFNEKIAEEGAWIGVDLDRTLARYDRNPNGYDPMEIGEPLWPMVSRIKRWIAVGIRVKIFTARVSGFDLTVEGRTKREAMITRIQDYLEKDCELPRLEVTNEKDYLCVALWDDIAVTMHPNTGYPAVSVEYR